MWSALVMCEFKLHYWPILTAVWFCFTFTISYIMAVVGGNVYPLFPFISDTGTKPPESCVFGQLLNIGAVFIFIVMYLRHVQIKNGIDICEDTGVTHKYNKVTTICGTVASFGMSIVANFQLTNVPSVHFVGAFMAFFIGTIYFIMQTKISAGFRKIYYRNTDCGLDRYTFYVRLFIGIVLLPLFVAHIICLIMSMQLYSGDILWWTEGQPGFQLRLAATFSEWIMALLMLVYTASFRKEFKAIKFKGLQFECIYK